MSKSFDMVREMGSAPTLPRSLVAKPWDPDRVGSALADSAAVYVIGRIVDYETPEYARAVAWAARQFPASQIVPARGHWASSADWLSEWPAFARSVAVGIIVTGPTPVVGRGVWREIEDLTALGVPVIWLHAEAGRRLVTPAAVLRRLPGDDWNAWARVEAATAPALRPAS